MAKERVLEVVRRIPLTKKACLTCGKEFYGQSVRKFCGTACRNKAAYDRNPDAYRAARMRSYRKAKGQKQD